MAVVSDLNKISVTGDLTPDDGFRLLAAIHNTVESKSFRDFALDFSNCTRAFAPQMLPICAKCQYYWGQGIDIYLTLPSDGKLSRLFGNTNWAYLIDPRSHEQSRYRGYTHSPVIKYSSGQEQHLAVNKVLDILLAAISHFKRDDMRYIEWAINEVTDNVLNHAETNVGGFVQITNHRHRQQIEFAVCDNGIGIPASLRGTYPKLTSDSEALDMAIREGVTRDKQFGQGNGLYGTWRICQKSGGDLRIAAGYASLKSSQKDGLHISKQPIPLNGTLVIARIGYNEVVDLSDALVFSGQKHVPLDYIDTHFDMDEHGNITFVMKDEANGFGSRAAGEPVRRKLLNLVSCLDVGRTIIDFKDIPLVSSSFADEIFGKMFLELGPMEFSKSIELRNLDPLVKNLIDRAVVQRMSQGI